MPAYTCRTCGVQYAESVDPPASCIICDDPRQYVGWGGQQWVTLDELAADGHRTDIRLEEEGLWGIGVDPQVGIGQRSLLVTTAEGNLLWDVTGFVDESAFEHVARLGGLTAVSASHPHFYGAMVEWAHAFGARILLPEADRRWVTRPDSAYDFYTEHIQPFPGVTLIRCGGHFPGSAVAHWQEGAGGRGVVLSGDTLQVAQDRTWLSFMWSYPNMIPLDAGQLDRIAAALDGLIYDRIYGGWWGKVVASDAAAAVRRSMDRYRVAIVDTDRLEA